MENFKFKDNQEKVLISVGCSHTQGSAFVKDIHRNSGEYELASAELKSKYGRSKVTSEFISRNFTWGGKLADLLQVDKFYNFGLGGLGIEPCIKSVRNYCYRTKDITNHLFVFQIPSPIRKEIIWIKDNIPRNTQIKFFQDDKNIPFRLEFLTTFFDFDINEIQSFTEIFHLQKFLEARGASIRLFLEPFQNITVTTRKQINRFNKATNTHSITTFHKELTDDLDYNFIFNNLNLINLLDLPEYTTPPYTLHEEGTVSGDYHKTERYNFELAQCVRDNLNNKRPKQLFDPII